MMGFIKKYLLLGAIFLMPMTLTSVARADAPDRHPDGGAMHLRGWGLTDANGATYHCPLYDDQGRLRGTLENNGTKGILSTTFASAIFDVPGNPGLQGSFDIDDHAHESFPDLSGALAQVENSVVNPATGQKYTEGELGIDIWAGRLETGTNMTMVQQTANMNVKSVEFRCVYIVDKVTRMPLFCLNCSFTFA